MSQIDKKTPVIESFILSLQARKPTRLLKKTSSNMLPRESYEVFQKSIFAEHFWVTTFGFRQRFI